jgi:hypothetical protein
MKYRMKSDKLVKSLKPVTPVKTGVQKVLKSLDSRLRGNDKKEKQMTLYETIKKDTCRIERGVY